MVYIDMQDFSRSKMVSWSSMLRLRRSKDASTNWNKNWLSDRIQQLVSLKEVFNQECPMGISAGTFNACHIQMTWM